MSESAFDHPRFAAELRWLIPDTAFNIIWTDKQTGEFAGSLYAEFQMIDGKRSVVFDTMNLQLPAQRQRVLRWLCRRMPAWLRERGIEQVVIPRPDGGLDVSEAAFEKAGFRKDGVYGRRVASMKLGPGGEPTEVEQIAEAALEADGDPGLNDPSAVTQAAAEDATL
jgi:hypothetical protein